MPNFDDEIPEPEYPEENPPKQDYQDDDQQQQGGRSQLDNAQDANDLRKKLSGEGKEGGTGAGDAAGAGETASEAGAEGAGAAAGAGETAGSTGAAATGSGGVAAGSMTAGSGGATAATGAAGAGAAVSGTAGVAAGGAAAATTGTAAAGIGATALSGPAAPITATGALIVGAATTDKGRKGLIFGLLGCLGCGGMLFFGLPLLIILTLGGGGGKTEAAGLGSNSTKLTISKKASITKIPKGATGAVVTYTITVANTTSKEATNINVIDTFSSTPQASFAAEITGSEPSFAIDKIAGGGNVSKTYTVTIPHTDFDPGWILFNSAKSSGTLDGSQEEASSGATVVIGNPPTGPPAFSPLKGGVTVTGYTFLQDTGHSKHPGLDIGSSNFEIYSPFAQPAIATFVGGDCGSKGYGEYVILQSGEWEVLMSHFACNSFKALQGEIVSSDKLLGVIGLTGDTSGPHVHYEVHQNGAKVNPANYNATTPHP